MRRPFLFVLLAVAPLALYGRTVAFGFVHADDVDLIVGNQAFLQRPASVLAAFTRSYFETEGEAGDLKTYYRPIAIASFAFDAQRAGADPAAYHATNVALHAAAGVLLYVWLQALGATALAALLAALLFAVHPLNAQAVCWIAGRNELLLGVFALASMLALARWQPGHSHWLVVHVLGVAGALFSKETGVFIPAAALLYLWLWRRPVSRTTMLLLVATYATLIGVWLVLRAHALAGSPPTASVASFVSNAPQFLVQLGKLVAPIDLNVMPAVDRRGVALGVLALVACSALARRLSTQVALFCAAWMVLFLAPALLVPDLPVYEHRMYVPMMGAALAFSQWGPQMLSRREGTAAVIGIAVTFAIVTFVHASVFRDPFRYWENGTRSTRFAPIAHVNLGQLYEQAGNLTRAADEYRRALALDPGTPKAHNNLGVVLMRLQQPARAVEHFREEVRRHPQNADAWYNLGLWADLEGNTAEARRYYERAIEANRAYRPAYEKLGRQP